MLSWINVLYLGFSLFLLLITIFAIGFFWLRNEFVKMNTFEKKETIAPHVTAVLKLYAYKAWYTETFDMIDALFQNQNVYVDITDVITDVNGLSYLCRVVGMPHLSRHVPARFIDFGDFVPSSDMYSDRDRWLFGRRMQDFQ